jgi:hypothetical protein
MEANRMKRAPAILQAMIVIISLSSIMAVGRSAQADSIKFCFRTNGDFVDNDYAPPSGSTEDAWVVDAPRPLFGAKAVVEISATPYFDGNLGDGIGSGDPGAGCTTTMTVPNANSQYQFVVFSSGGRIDTNSSGQHQLNAQVDDDDDTVHDINVTVVYNHSGGAGTFDVTLISGDTDAARLFKLYATAAYVLTRVGTFKDPAVTDIFLDNDSDASNQYDDGDVYINAGNTDEKIAYNLKYVIAHEIGHLLADLLFDGVGGDCTLVDDDCTSSPGPVGHGLGSKEYQSCAFTEGMADFLSAATWNG